MSRKQQAYKTKHPLFFPVRYETSRVQTVEHMLSVSLNLNIYKHSPKNSQLEESLSKAHPIIPETYTR